MDVLFIATFLLHYAPPTVVYVLVLLIVMSHRSLDEIYYSSRRPCF